MPRSLQARMTRRAISPRLATRIRWNIVGMSPRAATGSSSGGIDAEQDGAVLDRLRVLDTDLDDDAVALRLNLVEQFHGLDLADDGLRRHPGADLDVRLELRLLGPVEGADHGALDLVE